MKKIYFLASVLLAMNTLIAQTTVDFEDLILQDDSFYNGSDEAGSFTSHGVVFSNDFNSDWGSWSGFSYSNMQDNQTVGFTNQYSAYPASGADGSTIYGVYTGTGIITLPSEVDLTSVSITNTTYAYISMRDGDDFAKEFGVNGDKDFFYIYIIGHDENNDKIDSVKVDLADFTSDNATEHFILDSWIDVDLSVLQGVKFLTFTFTSSDVGEWGMNTPGYFALDNLIFTGESAGISTEVKDVFAMYPNPTAQVLNIKGEAGEYVVMNTNGQIVMTFTNNGMSSVSVSSLDAGVYFVKNNSIASTTKKLIVQ